MTPTPYSDSLYDPAAVGAAGHTEHVGGPRHYTGSEAGARLPWNCPACGKENVGRLVGEGCEACGSGVEAAKHVGVPEFVRREQGEATPAVIAALREGVVHRDVQTAFLAWLQRAGMNVGPLAAFEAGWHAARGGSVDGPEEIPTPAADAEMPEAILTGSAQGRTLIAALQYFADQVLAQHPEEIDSGEWLRPEEIPALIEEIRGRYV